MSTTKGKKKQAAEQASNGAEPVNPIESADPNNLEKIRSILFGAQMRETNTRVARLEEQLGREVSVLRDTMQRRIDELETYARDGFDAAAKRLASEQEQRNQAIDDLAGDLKKVSQDGKGAFTKLDDRLSEQERDLRARLLSQSKELSEDLQSRFDMLNTMVKEAVASLQDDKAGRQTMADLFEEMATRLRGDLQIPFDD